MSHRIKLQLSLEVNELGFIINQDYQDDLTIPFDDFP